MPLYFAYGSNLSVAQMKRRCPMSRPLKAGRLEGYRLAFTKYSPRWEGGVADIVRDVAQEVWGLVYELSSADLERLDHYEGYPDHYTRFQCDIEARNDIISDVWTYTVVEKGAFVAPTREYLQIIKDAAAELRFPEAYRAYLDAIETR